MNVLLIGGSGPLMNHIMIKLRKEGHRIYLLTGRRYISHDYEKVFETYNLTYDTECMSDIFDSVRPDVTLFMGAFDSNFPWIDEAKDSVKYVSSLINMLSAFAMGNYGRFIYLSSIDVFSGDYEQDIDEDEPCSASRFRGMAIAQGEDICRNYAKGRSMDILTLRIDHLYIMPENWKEVDGICANMCLSALEKKTITANSNHIFSLIYVMDAVEYIYKMMVCGSHFEQLYHISSGQEISELALAEMIRETAGEQVEIIEAHDWCARELLSNKRFDEEFGIRVFHSVDEIAPKIMSHMMRHKKLFLDRETEKENLWERFLKKAGWFITMMIPFLENLICFLPFFMLNNRAVGSQYFSRLDFFLLYVLLFAIIYGQQQAIFSAVLAVGGYLFRQMYTRTGFDVMLDYNTYIWIAQLFILGLTVGYMRDQISKLKSESEEERDFLNYKLSDMTEINQSNVRVKDALETQIVNHNDSIGKIYNITSQLDRYMPEEVLFYAADMVSKLMNSKDVAIYSVSNRDYARMAAATSERARSLGHSIRYRQFDELTEALLEHKVYINRAIDQKYPHMATAIYTGDEMQLILMVWGISWEQMTLGQANMLTVISYLIQNAVVRANDYMAALEDKRYVDGNTLLESGAFTTLVRAFYRAMDKGLTQCTLLKVQANPQEFREAGESLSKKLRQSDYLGTMEDGRMYALLANTSVKDAAIVITRFAECGYESEIVEELNA